MSQKSLQISALRANYLRIGTGNFLRPCRELNQAIREISALIRECRSRPMFWGGHLALPINPTLPRDLEPSREGEWGREMFEVADVRIPGEVARESAMMSPTIPI